MDDDKFAWLWLLWPLWIAIPLLIGVAFLSEWIRSLL